MKGVGGGGGGGRREERAILQTYPQMSALTYRRIRMFSKKQSWTFEADSLWTIRSLGANFQTKAEVTEQ